MKELTNLADFREEIKEIKETDGSKKENIAYQKRRLAERFLEKINPNSEPNFDVLTESKINEVYIFLRSLYGM